MKLGSIQVAELVGRVPSGTSYCLVALMLLLGWWWCRRGRTWGRIDSVWCGGICLTAAYACWRFLPAAISVSGGPGDGLTGVLLIGTVVLGVAALIFFLNALIRS